jgi:hypothetical protein
MAFAISEQEIRKRKKNTFWGAVFSLLLAGMIAAQNYQYPEKYNDVLLWSVVGFLLLANLVNYYRHLRYLRMIRDHEVEVLPRKVRFWTGGKMTELDVKKIAGMFYYRKKGELQHIQIKLKTHRGIRLEGYEKLNELGDQIADQIPPEHVQDKKL